MSTLLYIHDGERLVESNWTILVIWNDLEFAWTFLFSTDCIYLLWEIYRQRDLLKWLRGSLVGPCCHMMKDNFKAVLSSKNELQHDAYKTIYDEISKNNL
jgi:hypothetical protein